LWVSICLWGISF